MEYRGEIQKQRDRRARRIAGGEVEWTCEDGECEVRGGGRKMHDNAHTPVCLSILWTFDFLLCLLGGKKKSPDEK